LQAQLEAKRVALEVSRDQLRERLGIIFMFSRRENGRQHDLTYYPARVKGATQDFGRPLSIAGQNNGVYLVLDDDTELLTEFAEEDEEKNHNANGIIAGLTQFMQDPELGWLQFQSYTIEPNATSLSNPKSRSERGYWDWFLPVRTAAIRDRYGNETTRGFVPCNGHNVMLRESMLHSAGGWWPPYKVALLDNEGEYAEDAVKIDAWLLGASDGSVDPWGIPVRLRNDYGDPWGTVYYNREGEPVSNPLTDPNTGRSYTRYEYILLNHPYLVEALDLQRVSLVALVAEDLAAVIRGGEKGYHGRYAQYARIGEGSGADFIGSAVPSWKWAFGSTELLIKLYKEIVQSPEKAFHEKLDIIINLATFPAHIL
ncbi:MAG: hypothetical protein Q8R48_05205, partial [Candidatus Omnitrophota bacterium]|nr:hypothetical protein [Candidatus Omnitrophota bacterium]